MNRCEKAKVQLLRAKEGWNVITGFNEKLNKLNNEVKNCVQQCITTITGDSITSESTRNFKSQLQTEKQ